MSYLYWEKRWMQSYAMYFLQIWFLLDVFGRLEGNLSANCNFSYSFSIFHFNFIEQAHGSEYYECSRYKENPNIANDSATQVCFYSNYFSIISQKSWSMTSLLRFLWIFWGLRLYIEIFGCLDFGIFKRHCRERNAKILHRVYPENPPAFGAKLLRKSRFITSHLKKFIKI